MGSYSNSRLTRFYATAHAPAPGAFAARPPVERDLVHLMWNRLPWTDTASIGSAWQLVTAEAGLMSVLAVAVVWQRESC